MLFPTHLCTPPPNTWPTKTCSSEWMNWAQSMLPSRCYRTVLLSLLLKSLSYSFCKRKDSCAISLSRKPCLLTFISLVIIIFSPDIFLIKKFTKKLKLSDLVQCTLCVNGWPWVKTLARPVTSCGTLNKSFNPKNVFHSEMRVKISTLWLSCEAK